ncbi:hypothetical protein AAG906_026449 [Vitis piasezkii]
MELGESALMTMEEKDHNEAKNKKKGKMPPQGGIKKANRCFFYKKKGHMKKGCTKFHKWLEKKGQVEKQCRKQIKIVRMDRGGEYYGRYTKDGQAPGPFAKFLQEHGIVA